MTGLNFLKTGYFLVKHFEDKRDYDENYGVPDPCHGGGGGDQGGESGCGAAQT